MANPVRMAGSRCIVSVGRTLSADMAYTLGCCGGAVVLMKPVVGIVLGVLLAAMLAASVRWAYSQTILYKEKTVASRICDAIQPGMDIDEVRAIAAAEAGNFIVMTYDFGIASKSFCRCGVTLQDKKVSSETHKAWCL